MKRYQYEISVLKMISDITIQATYIQIVIIALRSTTIKK